MLHFLEYIRDLVDACVLWWTLLLWSWGRIGIRRQWRCLAQLGAWTRVVIDSTHAIELKVISMEELRLVKYGMLCVFDQVLVRSATNRPIEGRHLLS